jgi:hypothetical protein
MIQRRRVKERMLTRESASVITLLVYFNVVLSFLRRRGSFCVGAWNLFDPSTRPAAIGRIIPATSYDDNFDTPVTDDVAILRFHDDRRALCLAFMTTTTLSGILFFTTTHPAHARNLPTSNGAETSQLGTIDALVPIVQLRNNLRTLNQSLHEVYSHREEDTSNDDPLNAAIVSSIPNREQEFKRLFDAYSDQVSYKQKFLDQNAFLVYYTGGYDGPGRKKLEEDLVNERQTLQFGSRNDAWVAWENFLVERDYYYVQKRRIKAGSKSIEEDEDSFSEMINYLSEATEALDVYLKLAPLEDLINAEELLSSTSK